MHEAMITENTMKQLQKDRVMINRAISLWRVTSTVFDQLYADTEMARIGRYNTSEAMLKYPTIFAQTLS
ncbi:hypothetical protein TSUD_360870 [Trifolium subterraneum]|uniref:Uncharacterized protein n=1 Tax=Trifolium subterraneum TaxID=3900 RepID=A0A2Z6MYT8_TRISU|nr:hypothetical protein TSUD_360870 [Trifolium subterraneum]